MKSIEKPDKDEKRKMLTAERMIHMNIPNTPNAPTVLRSRVGSWRISKVARKQVHAK